MSHLFLFFVRNATIKTGKIVLYQICVGCINNKNQAKNRTWKSTKKSGNHPLLTNFEVWIFNTIECRIIFYFQT